MAQRTEITSLDDARLGPYRALKERELAREGGRFIAEGEQLVRRLVASDLKTESALLARKRADEIAPIIPPDVPVYVLPDEMVEHVLGYKFHSGVMAVGIRPPRKTLDDLLP